MPNEAKAAEAATVARRRRSRRCRFSLYSRHRRRFVFTSNGKLFALALFALCAASTLSADDEIKCFCDRLSCPGSLMCTGKWCLIGISTESGNGRIDQLCGYDDRDRPVECAKNWDRWAEVCACETQLCNTFAYLRSSLDYQQQSLGFGGGANGGELLHGGDESQRRYTHGQNPNRSKGMYQGANLIVLLVVMPLIVGGLAVCLVFVNYHCRMN